MVTEEKSYIVFQSYFNLNRVLKLQKDLKLFFVWFCLFVCLFLFLNPTNRPYLAESVASKQTIIIFWPIALATGPHKTRTQNKSGQRMSSNHTS